jgi:GntR family transcriptional regulator
LRADTIIAHRLDVPEGSPVDCLVLLRIADGEPLLLETLYLPANLAAALDSRTLEHESVYDALEQAHGLRATHARETIRPVVLSREDARRLNVRVGSAAFLVERVTLAGTRTIEWRQSLVRGDRYLYSVELAREGVDGLR